MMEVKRRIQVIDAYNLGVAKSPYKATTIEAIYLQFRKVLELIAFGSLVANKEEFSKQYEKFSKFWHAERLINDMEQVNPNFYPVPVSQETSEDPKIFRELKKIEEGFLTKKDFVKLYNKCGALMHASNPYGSQADYAAYEKNALDWRNKIVCLLNAHEIRLINTSNIYLIQMAAPEKMPTYTAFALVSQPDAL